MFLASGARLGGEFQVNTYTTDSQIGTSVSRAADGRFVVAYESYEEPAGITPSARVRRYHAVGTPAGPDFVVNQTLVGGRPAVASDPNFNFVVTWHAEDGIRARRFDSQGATRGGEFKANTYTPSLSQNPNVAVDGVGNFLLTWDNWDQEGPSSKSGVYGQRFGGLYPRALRVDATRNGVLEPGEAANVHPTWANFTGADQLFGGGIGDPGGPPFGVVQILNPTAVYEVEDGAAGECFICYAVQVPATAPRPAVHWDGSVVETITPEAQGQQKSWRLHVGESFSDVLPSSPFYRFVETLLHHGVTGGCTADAYCPVSAVTRDQMAVFVLL